MLLAGFESRLATWIYQACLLEATAPKPGNVHPDASFVDLCYADFVGLAEVAAPALASASRVEWGPPCWQRFESHKSGWGRIRIWGSHC